MSKPFVQLTSAGTATLISVVILVLSLVAIPSSAHASPGESPVGIWFFKAESELLVEVAQTGGAYTVTALGDTHVASSSCPLPSGTLLEKFSEAGAGYTGEAGLWNVSTCAFYEWAPLELEWKGQELAGRIGGSCNFGCDPSLIRAAPLVSGTAATAKEVSATVSGAVDPMRQATEYHVAFGLATSGWCSNSQDGDPPGFTVTEPLAFTDHTAHPVTVSFGGLMPATRYCARIIAANPTGTTEGAAVFFFTAPAAIREHHNPPPPPPPPPAPVVTITSQPPKETADQTAAFAFTGVTGGAYECRVDAGAWGKCVSGASFGPLEPGDHRFEVREVLDGVTGPAASWSWTIDLPKECILKVARARVFAFTHQSKARLVIHYKAYTPARVTVSYSLVGPEGGLGLGTASAEFKTAGIFRLGEVLDEVDVARLKAATSLRVSFSIPSAPSICTRYYTKRLTIPKRVFGQTVWFQSDSKFASGGVGR